ncbi:MAG: hypothetical protein KDD37_03035 [Bdellovibrionales bacterium]|nr:hypothetical protein [Bdellovibrionales bacterium]
MDKKVDWLLLDLNSYFASVEQELDPSLRNKPVAVVPTQADSTSVIAASYEAKAFGVKTGVRVGDAKRMCPGLKLVEARHDAYIEYHHAIIKAIETCLPVSAVLSIDEMACKLMGSECNVDKATEIALKIKHTIKTTVGTQLGSSIGLAPNRYLAKVASDMQKPDGLTILTKDILPHRLFTLKLRDFPGVGAKMEERLHKFGIRTVEQMFQKDVHHLREVWGGINGERFWHWIHGHDIADIKTTQSSISQSHVLSPEHRNTQGVYAVLQRLIHKAAYRLRQDGMWATHFYVKVKYMNDTKWEASSKLIECQDTLSFIEALAAFWSRQKFKEYPRPIKAAIVLGGLVPNEYHNLSLFGEDKKSQLSKAMDKLNSKLGKNSVYFAGIQDTKTAAPTRIAFTNIPDEIL